MSQTQAHPSLYQEHATVVALPPEARPVGLATRAALVATANRAIAFHEEVSRYHADEAAKIKATLARLTGAEGRGRTERHQPEDRGNAADHAGSDDAPEHPAHGRATDQNAQARPTRVEAAST